MGSAATGSWSMIGGITILMFHLTPSRLNSPELLVSTSLARWGRADP